MDFYFRSRACWILQEIADLSDFVDKYTQTDV